MFQTSLELFDLPLCKWVLRLILCYLTLNTLRDVKRNSRSLFRYWEFNKDLSGKMVCREGCSNFQSKLQFVLSKFVDEWIYSKGGLIVSIDSIVHHKEFSIRWVYYKSFHCFEISQVNAFVEIAIIKDYSSNLLAHIISSPYY